MILKKMEITNFRCYKDTQVIEFNDDGKITLIVGNSGAGKSTITQFINWMFYDVVPLNKGKISEQKPVYNEVFFEELSYNSPFDVTGKIRFNHNNTEYELIKNYHYKKDMYTSILESKDLQLNYKYKNGSWIEYKGNAMEKINEIIPKALSKYFFFSGEEEITKESSKDLNEAIYNLFGISKYVNALDHIGEKGIPNTVLYYYHKQKQASKPAGVTESSNLYLQNYTKFKAAYEKFKEFHDKRNKYLEEVERQIEELTKTIAKSSKPEDEKAKIEKNSHLIKLNDEKIKSYIKSIGKILYRSVPYLLLSDQIKITRDVLSASAKEEKTFDMLKKETLLDIKKQGVCVCGRCIDDDALNCLNKLIKSMPPDSYNYIYNDFVRTVGRETSIANNNYDQVTSYLHEATLLRQENDKLEEENSNILKKLNKSDDLTEKENAVKLIRFKKKREELKQEIKDSYSKYTQYEAQMKKFDKLYSDAFNYETEKNMYNDKIEIIEMIKNTLLKKKESRINKTKEILNNSIKEIYDMISTKKEDLTDLSIIKDDFTPRDGYFSGGQGVIEVYSYIIGMIKAIHIDDDNDKTDDFPVLIDAPFSKLDNIQLNHVIDVIPTIVSQVIMSTIDVGRFKNINLSNIGNVWLINTNDEKNIANITKGEL